MTSSRFDQSRSARPPKWAKNSGGKVGEFGSVPAKRLGGDEGDRGELGRGLGGDHLGDETAQGHADEMIARELISAGDGEDVGDEVFDCVGGGAEGAGRGATGVAVVKADDVMTGGRQRFTQSIGPAELGGGGAHDQQDGRMVGRPETFSFERDGAVLGGLHAASSLRGVYGCP